MVRKRKTRNKQPKKPTENALEALHASLKRNRDIISIIAVLVQIIAIIVAITVFYIENRPDDEENPLKTMSPRRYQMIFIKSRPLEYNGRSEVKKMTRENVIQVLRSVTDESLLKYKAQILGIFGSVARGDESEDSDVDVLVDFTEKADLFDFVGLALFLEEKLQRRVDVVPSDTIKSESRNTVMKDAIYI
jgi:hypothetical protein